MSEVRNLLRWFLLVTAVLVLTACAHNPDNPGLLGNPCSAGAGKDDRNAPIVCVDDTGEALTVSPDPITVHDVGKSDRQPVLLHWWTRSGGNGLGIQIADGCVTDVNCRGGHCWAKSKETDASGARCKYTVSTSKHLPLDPEVIIVDCCAP